MKMFGVIILTIMTGGIYGIVYAINKKRRRAQIKNLENALMYQQAAMAEFGKLTKEQQEVAYNMYQSQMNYMQAHNDIME